MSLPQFTATTKLADSSDTKVASVVRAFNTLIDNLQQIFTSLTKKVQLDSVLLPSISLSTGSNTIPHTLGRTLTGWKITRIDAAAIVYDMQTANTDPQTYLVLFTSGPATVSIEVF